MPAISLHDWACLRSELVWIYDHAVAETSRHMLARRASSNYAWYLRRGSCTISTGSTRHLLKPGMWLFLPQGEARQEFSSDAAILSVCFRYQWPSGENAVSNPAGLLFPGSEFPALEQRAVRLERLVRRHLSAGTSYKLQSHQAITGPLFLRFQALFMNWLELWLQINLSHGIGVTNLRTQDDRLTRTARCLNEAPLDRPYPRAQLIRETKLSEVHLNRLFLNAFGITPRKYWDRRKLEYARDCLDTTDMPVKEVSFRLGFLSDAHFAVWFRRHETKTPSEYRARN